MWITDYFPNDMDIDGSMRCVVYVHCRRGILRFCLVRLAGSFVHVSIDYFLFVFGGYILSSFLVCFCTRLCLPFFFFTCLRLADQWYI